MATNSPFSGDGSSFTLPPGYGAMLDQSGLISDGMANAGKGLRQAAEQAAANLKENYRLKALEKGLQSSAKQYGSLLGVDKAELQSLLTPQDNENRLDYVARLQSFIEGVPLRAKILASQQSQKQDWLGEINNRRQNIYGYAEPDLPTGGGGSTISLDPAPEVPPASSQGESGELNWFQ